MNRDAAKSLAVEALSFLAKDFERLGRFLALTGVDPKDIRALARESEFLTAVLDHVLSESTLRKHLRAKLDMILPTWQRPTPHWPASDGSGMFPDLVPVWARQVPTAR
jgi:Protein of unknown function (DUF3572)